jgi:hypothetical protein
LTGGSGTTTAGLYTLTFQDAYRKLLSFDVKFQSSTGLGAAAVVGVKSATFTGTKAVIVFQCTTAGGGSATDPGSGETMYIKATMSNSSAV